MNANPDVVETSLTGQRLLECSLLNKGSAFGPEERAELGLLGLLPPHVSTMEEQLERTYGNYRRKETDLERYIFLTSLQDRNETLFYRLLQEHIEEMMPVIYTPVVGAASRSYSRIYRRPRGLYIGYPDRNNIHTLLANVPSDRVRVIVVTDGERILGLGDLGVGGMGIPIGKLALYTLCAGIPPWATLPVVLDVGTNNAELLADPLYLGWRHERVRGGDYDAFVKDFVGAVSRRFPDVLLQWEDFCKDNASRLLEDYRDRICSFNDDIQGTGAVTLAGLLAAAKATDVPMAEQRVVILGAGSAATGIGDQIVAAAMSEGVPSARARGGIWLVDSQGLVHEGRRNLEAIKRRYARPVSDLSGFPGREGRIGLAEVVGRVRPTALLGTSAQPGAFTEDIVREMARHVARPIIFPLSNPTSKSEAAPADLMAWTGGRAVVATGSPFPDVVHGDRVLRIGQCNNAYIFPGVGLGVTASGARRVTDGMFLAAARALSEMSPAIREADGVLYPPLTHIREVSFRVALAVAAEAVRSGHAPERPAEELETCVRNAMWRPHYARIRPVGAGRNRVAVVSR